MLPSSCMPIHVDLSTFQQVHDGKGWITRMPACKLRSLRNVSSRQSNMEVRLPSAKGRHLVNTRQRVHDDRVLGQDLEGIIVNDVLPTRLLVVLWSVLCRLFAILQQSPRVSCCTL